VNVNHARQMAAQFARAPHQGHLATPAQNAPNAALLIDFDNVTMGIRSDLSKELKKLLNSDIIKGKVTVQRAYADWRRYPQYIVPLSEASVDLIFAPAHGSSKKNATDIRLAIDALELVFTRPEIGTFILISGDSDFSSLVLKLKEYGKYVIGVGIRESSSDLLVQNCDEYYSYSALSGLVRAGEDVPSASEDPWVLVDRAVRQMAERGDVMRSDRLKQVMIELDPSFDERTLGYSKFSKFLIEAANRGCLRLRKLENGQYEVAPADTEVEEPAPEEEEQAAPRARREEGSRRGRRDREERAAQREREREERPSRRERAERVAADQAPVAAASQAAAPAPSVPAAEAQDPAEALRAAYELLRRAVEGLVRRPGEAVRDSDVKRRMLELQPGWDESALGFSKFSRFLRQAHDMEIVDLRKTDNGGYEVAPSSRGRVAATVSGAAEPTARGERDADRAASRSRRESAKQKEAPAGRREAASAEPVAAVKEEPAAAGEPEATAVETPAAAQAVRTPVSTVPVPGVLRFRRGTRGRSLVLAAPPPVLAGQTVPLVEERNGATPPEESAPAADAAAEARKAAEASSPERAEPRAEQRSSRSRRGARKARQEAPAPTAAGEPAAGTAPTAEAAVVSAAPAGESFPTDPAAVIARLSSYKGVGRKTAEALIEALGAENVFPTLRDAPDRIREVLGGRRAERLIAAWQAEASAAVARTAATAEPAAAAPAEAAETTVTVAEPAAAGEAAAPAGARKRARGRRGGRRAGRRGKSTANDAVAAGGA